MGSEWTECMITNCGSTIRNADQCHLSTKQHIFAGVMSLVLKEPLLSGNLTYPPIDHVIRYEINYVGVVPPTLQGFRR